MAVAFQSLPPRGRGTAAGFPETNEMSFGGSRVGGGRSLRDFGVLISFIVTRSPSVAFGASSLPEGAFVRHTSADSGFGLLPDYARTSTRYACPRRKRRESRKCSLIYLIIYDIISLKIKAKLYFASTNTSWNIF